MHSRAHGPFTLLQRIMEPEVISIQAVSAETTSLGIITYNTISYDASLTNADMLDEFRAVLPQIEKCYFDD